MKGKVRIERIRQEIEVENVDSLTGFVFITPEGRTFRVRLEDESLVVNADRVTIEPNHSGGVRLWSTNLWETEPTCIGSEDEKEA